MKTRILRILFSLMLLSLVFAVGCEDSDSNEGINGEAEGSVNGNVTLIDGNGNAVRVETIEEEMLHEEGEE